jgi:hypothetical protein
MGFSHEKCYDVMHQIESTVSSYASPSSQLLSFNTLDQRKRAPKSYSVLMIPMSAAWSTNKPVRLSQDTDSTSYRARFSYRHNNLTSSCPASPGYRSYRWLAQTCWLFEVCYHVTFHSLEFFTSTSHCSLLITHYKRQLNL